MSGFAETAQKRWTEVDQAPFKAPSLADAAKLLGGRPVLGHKVVTAMDAHELLVAGLPGGALAFIERNLTALDPLSFEKAIGMSLRTVQRRKADPSLALSVEQGGRLWKFAEILAKATEVMGSQRAAEEWLIQPAMGLDRHRPIDLLSTPSGTQIVETFLGQLDYGVYV